MHPVMGVRDGIRQHLVFFVGLGESFKLQVLFSMLVTKFVVQYQLQLQPGTLYTGMYNAWSRARALKTPNVKGPKKWLTKLERTKKKWLTAYCGQCTQKKVNFRTSTRRQNNAKCRKSADGKPRLECNNGMGRTPWAPRSVITAQYGEKMVDADVARTTAAARRQVDTTNDYGIR